MTLASGNAGGDFRVGEVLSRAWRVFTGNILFFLAVPLVINGIYFLFNFVLGKFFVGFRAGLGPPVMVGVVPWTVILVSLGTLVLFLCLHMVAQGVLLMGAFQRLRGEPLRVGAALQRSLARFLPLIAVSLLIILAMIVVIVASFVVLWILGLVLGRLAVVLSFAIFIPIFILGIMWSVVVPACLVEGLGPIGSMARSADLTRGYRWKVTGIVLLLGLIALVAFIIMIFLLRLGPVAALVFEVVWLVVWTGYLNCVIIMIYHDLRVAKEGVDTAQIATVFD
jgi:hypothetical protein